MQNFKTRQLFLKTASKIQQQKKNKAKLEIVMQIEKELIIAELLLRKIEKNKEAKTTTIISLNKKIISLKKYVQGIKAKLKGL